MKISKALQEAIEASSYSHEDVARQLGISPQLLDEIIQDSQTPIQRVCEIAYAAGYALWLLPKEATPSNAFVVDGGECNYRIQFSDGSFKRVAATTDAQACDEFYDLMKRTNKSEGAWIVTSEVPEDALCAAWSNGSMKAWVEKRVY